MSLDSGTSWRISRVFAAAFGGLLLVLATACGGSNESPTSPVSTDLVVRSAVVSVNGQSVGGQNLTQGHGDGDSTRFEAQLMAGGVPAPGQVMWLEFDRPRGMGMGHHVGRAQLYDDGSHGDRVAGDGLYCLEDVVGDYGCHSAQAAPGEYHFEFYGLHSDGHETNHLTVTVTIHSP
jgi:hypothetical protein